MNRGHWQVGDVGLAFVDDPQRDPQGFMFQPAAREIRIVSFGPLYVCVVDLMSPTRRMNLVNLEDIICDPELTLKHAAAWRAEGGRVVNL